jgi:hypothetical protein
VFSGRSGRERLVDPYGIRGATDEDSECKSSEMSPTINEISTSVEESDIDSLVQPNIPKERNATLERG